MRNIVVYYKKIKNLDFNTKALYVCFLIAFVLALLVRYSLRGVITPDFTDFLQPWMQHLSEKGLSGLGDSFSNYNAPYLVLLWLASFLPFSDLSSVKLISVTFDIVLATGVFFVVQHFRKGVAPCLAFLSVMLAPVVIQNGSMWGQCDSIYTSFIVFAFFAYLKGRLNLTWLLWGVAFSFKLQAIFFAPFLVFLTLYNKKSFYGPFIAGGVILILSSLPVLYGKSLVDVAGIYIGQTAPPNGLNWGLAWFAPTAYQWISNEYYPYVRKAGLLFGAVIALACAALAFVKKYDQKTILVIATLTLISVPFFLPTIHERYMFSAEIFLIITAFVIPRFVWTAIAMQIITTMAYVTYFTQGNQSPPIAFPLLSLGVFLIITTLVLYVLRGGYRGRLVTTVV